MAACSFCTQPSVSAHLVRLGEIPHGWRFEKHPSEKDADKSRLQVVRVCATHKQQVPR